MKNLLLLPGDGIGPEIMAEAEKILHLLQKKARLAVALDYADLGGCAVDASGDPYPEATKAKARAADAVLLASVGGPKWDNLPRAQRPETGLLAIRADLGLFANLRPAQVMDALIDRSALKPERVQGLDILIVRELTGGIYFGQPRGIETNAAGEREGYNTLRYNESEVRRIARVAFEAARGRQKRLCSIDKMNVLESSQLWRETVEAVAADYPDVELTHLLVDNAAMQLVRDPRQFDVIVTGNLFGDILSDEASMLTGSIGLLPSASLRGDGVGLFEPVPCCSRSPCCCAIPSKKNASPRCWKTPSANASARATAAPILLQTGNKHTAPPPSAMPFAASWKQHWRGLCKTLLACITTAAIISMLFL